MSKKTKANKIYMEILKLIIERELKERDVSELDLTLCKSYAKSIADFINFEKDQADTNPKLLLEDLYHVQ